MLPSQQQLVEFAPWAALGAAIVCEITAAYYMKEAHGFRNWRASLLAIGISIVNVSFTIFTLGQISLAVAWAIYTAIELVGTICMGFLIFGEDLTPGKLSGLVLSVTGVIVLVLAEEELLPGSWNTPFFETDGSSSSSEDELELPALAAGPSTVDPNAVYFPVLLNKSTTDSPSVML